MRFSNSGSRWGSSLRGFVLSACLVAWHVGSSANLVGQTAVDAAGSRTGTLTIELEGVPSWLKAHQFQQDKFTFVRLQYDSSAARRGAWATDYPDADLNLAMQIGRLTKLDVSEPSKVLQLTDAEIAKYPFAYISEPGSLQLSNAEVAAMREYLLAGGFILIDDFWGKSEWENVQSVLKKVLPGREPRELPTSHPVFHCVFDLKEPPQVTSIHEFVSRQRRAIPLDAPRYMGIEDNNGRLMVLLCHNTDLADGWERAGEDERFKREVSQLKAFPMGINIVYFALTQAAPVKP